MDHRPWPQHGQRRQLYNCRDASKSLETLFLLGQVVHGSNYHSLSKYTVRLP